MSEPSGQSDLLRQFVASSDVPCPNCGYNLRALMTDRCPECDAALELRVGLVEPRLGAFLCGAIGLGAGLGFNGLVLMYMLLIDPRHMWPEALPLVASLAILGPLLALWLRTGARQRRLPPELHWSLAVLPWFLAMVSAIWFFAQT